MTTSPNKTNKAVLELKVVNHPGVMSHICGLFARRAYNLEGILCLPIEGGDYSRIWLLVNEEALLDQVIAQTQKLIDVVEIKHHVGVDHRVFVELEEVFHRG